MTVQALLVGLLCASAAAAGGSGLQPQQAPVPGQVAPTDSAAALPRPDSAALVFRGDTLGFVYGSLGPFSPEERAAAFAERLAQLRGDGVGAPDVHVVDIDGRSEVWANETSVVAATRDDATASGGTMSAAGERLAAAVRAGLDEPVLTRSLRQLLMGLLWTALATAALYALLKLIALWYPRLYRRIRDIQEDKLPSVRFQDLEILSGEKIEAALLFLARVSRWVVTAALLVLYFPLVFSFFPATRLLAQRIFGLTWEPLRVAGLAVVGYLPNLFYIGVIVVLTHYAVKIVRVVFTALDHGTLRLPGFYPDWAMPTFTLVRVLAIAFAVILIWPYLPSSDSLAFKGVAGFLGLLLTFGSTGAISNVVGGVVMIYMRPFQIGDRVKIADTVGDVVERGMLVTRLRTPKNVEVTIPNSMVLGNYIVNYSSTAKEGGVILHTTVTLGYDLDWRKVHEAMTEAARRTEGVLADPAPFVLQTALGDYSVSYELNAYTDRPQSMARIYSGLHQNLQDALAEAGIEILSPVYHALRDGNLSTIPAPHTPPESDAPSFRVRKAED